MMTKLKQQLWKLIIFNQLLNVIMSHNTINISPYYMFLQIYNWERER